MRSSRILNYAIIAGLLAGALVGQLLFDPSWSMETEAPHKHQAILDLCSFLGFTVFMGLLKMLIIPLIAVSVLVAVTSVGNIEELGYLGSRTLFYYFATMLLAVTVGLLCVTAVQPGAGIETSAGFSAKVESIQAKAAGGLLGVFTHLVELMIPTNIFKAMSEGQTLPVICFFIFLGVVTTMLGKKGKPIVELAQALFSVLMRMVELVLYLAPLGVFALLVWTVARIGLGVFTESIGLYMATVLAGLFIHGAILLPSIYWFFTRQSPLQFLFHMKEALLTAFGTDSSTATLPVTIECATDNAGIPKKTAGLVLPLGSTINMDGTALYEAVAVVFMAQAYGIELGLAQLVLIAITATLAAVGAAGIPSAGLITMVIVLEAVNDSLGGGEVIPIAAVGLIIGVDRLLDMVRTVVNVWGDAVGAAIVSALDKKRSSS